MHFAIHTMGDDLDAHPTKRQVQVLRAIFALNERLGRPVSHTEIAEELGQTAGSTSQTVWRLHAKGLVERAEPHRIEVSDGTGRRGGQWKVSRRGLRWCV